MRYRLCTARSISWLRVGAAATATALALGFASPAAAAGTVAGNKKCRTGVGSQLSAVATKGMQSQEKCYNLAAATDVTSAICMAPDSFPFTIIDGGAYLKKQGTAETNLITKAKPACVATDAAETLDNYANGDPGDTYSNISSLLAGNAGYIIGTEDLGGDKVKKTCLNTIAAARRNIATKMLSEAAACQKKLDKTATLAGFGPLSMSPTDCLAETTPVTNKITAQNKAILAKCGTAPKHLIPGYPSGDAVGACSPLPDCVADAALALGRNLALAEYPGQTCEGTVTPAGRTISVSLAAPAGVGLGGADVRVEYPHFQAGVPGNGTEDSVQAAITSSAYYNATDHDGALDVNLAFSPAFSGSGVAFDVQMDECEKFSGGLCSVTTSATCEQNKDCAPHCLEHAYGGTGSNTNTWCTVDADCPAPPVPNPQGLIRKCICPTCQSKKCLAGGTLCHVNADCPAIGGLPDYCAASESCIAQTEHCSVSQYLGCGKPSDPDCPAGEECTTQAALTNCTVTSALDEYANEVDGVTCTLNVTEP